MKQLDLDFISFLGVLVLAIILLFVGVAFLERHPSKFVEAPYCQNGICWSCQAEIKK